MKKSEKIKEVMSYLDRAYTVRIDNGKLWKKFSNCNLEDFHHREYIFYTHFGQSAIRRNLKELTWVINTIFEKKNKDFSFTVEV